MTVRAIAQTVEAYKRDKAICPKFREFAAMPFDQRMMSFKGVDRVSLLTLKGRVIVPFVMGKYQAERFSNAKGQCDLVYRPKDNKWFLLVTIDMPDGAEIPVTDFIGVDMGIVNLVATSDGDFESGDDVKRVSKKYADLRQTLQRKASAQSKDGKRPRSIRRFQKRISERVSNFKKHVNHCISRKIVSLSTGTHKGIALEDLTDIRQRCEKRHRKAQRSIFSGWSFYQLRSFIEYKSKLAGIPVVLINPKNTSRECSKCGHCEKANRVSQNEFICKNCDLHISADFNAALNIRGRAIVGFAQSSESLEFKYSS
jgi:IS605 OrfB family transposase